VTNKLACLIGHGRPFVRETAKIAPIGAFDARSGLRVFGTRHTRGVEHRALGLRVKLGWALAVVVAAGEDERPHVVARDELRFAAADGAFAYHAAMDATPDERASVIASAEERAADAAAELLGTCLADHDAATVGIIVGRGVRRIPLERILASSRLYHTAEAELLQESFTEAARRLSVPCARVPFDAAESHAQWDYVGKLASRAGRPWQKDHKLAATAAGSR
jgi:hypothetical protein